MIDYTNCTVFLNLKNHVMPLLQTVIITDNERRDIKGVKVLLRLLNKNTLFNTASNLSDIVVVNYYFDELDLLTFENVDDSYILSKDQRYMRKYKNLLSNSKPPIYILVKQYLGGILPVFMEEDEVLIESIAPIVVERKIKDYIDNFRLQTMYVKIK